MRKNLKSGDFSYGATKTCFVFAVVICGICAASAAHGQTTCIDQLARRTYVSGFQPGDFAQIVVREEALAPVFGGFTDKPRICHAQTAQAIGEQICQSIGGGREQRLGRRGVAVLPPSREVMKMATERYIAAAAKTAFHRR